MLSAAQLQDLAGAATILRRKIESAIVEAPASPSSMIAYMRLTEDQRAVQRDLTAVCAHLADVSSLLHRTADRSAPIIDMVIL